MSERFILDTNILSELAKPSPDEQVVEWLRHLVAPSTSAIVCYELSRGIERMGTGKRRAFLEAWFAEVLTTVETIAVDEATAIAASRLEAVAKRRGRPIDVRDLLIAATAQVHQCTVGTRNITDFAGLGVMVYDPFTDVRVR